MPHRNCKCPECRSAQESFMPKKDPAPKSMSFFSGKTLPKNIANLNSGLEAIFHTKKENLDKGLGAIFHPKKENLDKGLGAIYHTKNPLETRSPDPMGYEPDSYASTDDERDGYASTDDEQTNMFKPARFDSRLSLAASGYKPPPSTPTGEDCFKSVAQHPTRLPYTDISDQESQRQQGKNRSIPKKDKPAKESKSFSSFSLGWGSGSSWKSKDDGDGFGGSSGLFGSGGGLGNSRGGGGGGSSWVRSSWNHSTWG